ncbi:uncharacterized protein [Cardiocondyla obscurior]
MALSIAIVFIGVVAYAAAGPVQPRPNTLQQNEYGDLSDRLARYWEDRRMNEGVKRNLDQIGGGHLVRDTDKQFKGIFNEEDNRLTQYLNPISDRQMLDATRRETLFIDQFRNGNLNNFPINSVTFADTTHHSYSPDLSDDQINNQSFMDQLIKRYILNAAQNADEEIARDLFGSKYLARNLDQIGGGHLVRNLDQIGGGHVLRNLDSIGGGHLVRNLDQIGGGHVLRNLDSIGGEHLVRNLDQIGGGHVLRNLDSIGGGHLVRNLDQIGGGHLVRNLDSIGGGNLVRSLYYQNAETKRRTDKPVILGTQRFMRNLDQIGGGNLVRNLDQIEGDNLMRNLDQIGGGNFVRSLK